MSAPELEIAATVTRGAVRCSALLAAVGLDDILGCLVGIGFLLCVIIAILFVEFNYPRSRK